MAGRIVVGIDGSEHADAALRFAVQEGRLREATVEAVHAWAYLPMPSTIESGLAPLAWSDPAEAFEANESGAEAVAHDQVTGLLGPDHGITVTVVQGEPADVLLRAAEGAELLVVGNRGRGGLVQALLGSTSARVADKAPCPVVIVRAQEDAA